MEVAAEHGHGCQDDRYPRERVHSVAGCVDPSQVAPADIVRGPEDSPQVITDVPAGLVVNEGNPSEHERQARHEHDRGSRYGPLPPGQPPARHPWLPDGNDRRRIVCGRVGDSLGQSHTSTIVIGDRNLEDLGLRVNNHTLRSISRQVRDTRMPPPKREGAFSPVVLSQLVTPAVRSRPIRSAREL